jgi:FkbM family methyltransferase
MFDFTRLWTNQPLGRLLRRSLNLMPRSMTVRIVQGPLRGKKWVRGSGVNGYWLGSYEWKEQSALIAQLTPGNVFFDIGAHVGFYSLLAATVMGTSGVVYAFEPVHDNLAFLRKHIDMNGYMNIHVIETAIGDVDGTANFMLGAGSSLGTLSPLGEVVVSVARIDTLVESGRCPEPDVMKIDVEGKFPEVLNGARETVRRKRPVILFESDYADERSSFEVLRSFGYEISPVGADTLESAQNFVAVPGKA